MEIYKVFQGCIIIRGRTDVFDPVTSLSKTWKHWKTNIDEKTCLLCVQQHGKVYHSDEEPNPTPPLHPKCRCVVEAMRAVEAGMASREGSNGADWWIRYKESLPDYYISLAVLAELGWKSGESPAKYAPGKMIFGGIYRNNDGRLPNALGRIWYEADLNYYSGRRNRHRIIWSNDGLMFVTYNHYRDFIEVKGD